MSPCSMRTDTANTAFDHLEALLEKLPSMKKLDGKLSRAREARKLMDMLRIARGAENELARAEAAFLGAQTRFEEARQKGDGEDATGRAREMLYWGNQRSFHSAPAKNNRRQFEQALCESSFTSERKIEEAFIPIEEFDRSLAQIESYREDYAATLAYCKEHGSDALG